MTHSADVNNLGKKKKNCDRVYLCIAFISDISVKDTSEYLFSLQRFATYEASSITSTLAHKDSRGVG